MTANRVPGLHRRVRAGFLSLCRRRWGWVTALAAAAFFLVGCELLTQGGRAAVRADLDAIAEQLDAIESRVDAAAGLDPQTRAMIEGLLADVREQGESYGEIVDSIEALDSGGDGLLTLGAEEAIIGLIALLGGGAAGRAHEKKKHAVSASG